MKPDKIPPAFVHQQNIPLDPSSHYFGVKHLPCFDCDQPLAGNMGVQVSRRLRDSIVGLHVLVHGGCQLKHAGA